MPIQDLPVEVMRHILTYSLRGDFVNLQKACRSLHTLTEPLLYEEINWSMTLSNNDNFPLLLRTLLDRPQLGHHIKRINVVNWGMLWRSETQRLAENELERLATRGANLNISASGWRGDEKTLMYDLGQGRPDRFLILVLSYCTTLQYLSLGCALESISTPEPRQPAALQQAISDQITLKEVGYGFNPRGDSLIPWTSSRIESLFLLPQLKTLRIQVTETGRDLKTDEALRACRVTTLELRDCYLKEESVGHLISRVPDLKSLRIGLTRDATPSDEGLLDSFLDCSKLALSISKFSAADGASNAVTPEISHGIGLENLAISIRFFITTAVDVSSGGTWEDGRDGNDGWARNWGIRSSIGSLRSFTQLKTLEISPVILFGWHAKGARRLKELIPDSLQRLTLRCDLADWQEYEWNADAISAVFDDFLQGGKYMSLKNVVLWWMDYDYDDYYDECLLLREKCRLRGIHLGVKQVKRFHGE